MFHLNNPPQPSASISNLTESRIQHRVSGDYRNSGIAGFPAGDGALPVPTGPQAHLVNGGLRNRGPLGGAVFEGARSPPGTKNTSHVPCKFFRSGQCQAGKACPFSHSTDVSTVDTPCKYFSKGNCKFGAKCALAHVLPNGRRVNRPNGAVGGHLNLGGRVDPQSYHHQDSALANSLLAQQASGNPPTFGHQFSHYVEGDFGSQTGMNLKLYDSLPLIDTGYISHPGSKYGSPRDDSRLPLSPVAHLSALDAPMPASFDSQGISYMARHGPVAASMPSKFGLESPPSSLPKKTVLPSDALRNLHDSAFGRESRAKAPTLGSSPLGSGDEGLGQRTMHSQRMAKQKMMSSSLPRARAIATEDWDEGFIFGGEEDFLPTSLHDLLTPQEKMRRLSRTEQDPNTLREGLSGLGTPADSSSKVGSPSTASPSRYGALFARQKRDEDGNSYNPPTTSAFGHVGSPLRNSSLHPSASPSLRATSNHTISGDMSPYFASPPRQSSMSMISQQLSRSRLASRAPDLSPSGSDSTTPTPTNNALHPQPGRHASAPTTTTNLNRAISSSSITTSGRIDEEHSGSEFVFAMEDEDEGGHGKRYSGSGWTVQPPQGSGSPRLGAVGGERGPRRNSGGVEYI